MIKIINDDCLVALRNIEDNSIDSVVTDPPYGISFMNKHWDYDVPKVEVWKEVLRVLKPGGHILCACGTRTQHRMTVNIEDAGFEIRDVVAWIYGSGFPKSLNIGKAVDALQGNDREFISEVFKGNNAGKKSGIMGETVPRTDIISKGNSEYEGFGTALKPAMELWTLARKPLEQKTVAENVLKYGTGGINIDECRVEGRKDWCDTKQYSNGISWGENKSNSFIQDNSNNPSKELGRFPANVIHDGSDEVLDAFPDNKGACAPVKSGQKGFGGEIYGRYAQAGDDGATFYNDGMGSASRFFYCAKASKSERNKGCDDFEEKDQPHSTNMKCANCGLPILSGTGKSCKCDNKTEVRNKTKNFHPTVKPVSLMRYLCRMITPKNGIILDPFMGSGSTGIGAKVEGFSFIGIERELEYCNIAQARIDAWEEELPPKEKIIQPTLF